MNVCVVGLGYVGLTLALVLADCGIKVKGVDTKKETVNSLRAGKPTISEKNVGPLLSKHKEKNFIISDEIDDTNFDVFVISVCPSVPTCTLTSSIEPPLRLCTCTSL